MHSSVSGSAFLASGLHTWPPSSSHLATFFFTLGPSARAEGTCLHLRGRPTTGCTAWGVETRRQGVRWQGGEAAGCPLIWLAAHAARVRRDGDCACLRVLRVAECFES